MGNKKIIIFGIKSIGELIYEYISQRSDYEVACFTIDKSFMGGIRTFRGLPVVAFEELHEIYPPGENDIVLAFQNDKLFENRKRVFNECKLKGYNLPNIIHKASTIDEGVSIGEGNIIWGTAYIGACCKIGNCNTISTGVQLSHHVGIGNFNLFSSSVTAGGNLNVGNNNFLGLNATIRHEITIGSYCLVGASSYVSFDLQDYSVIVPDRSKLIKGLSSKDMDWY